MSMTSFRSDAFNHGIDINKLKKTCKLGANTAITNEATANATDLATAQALANALKTKLNTLLTELRTQGVIS